MKRSLGLLSVGTIAIAGLVVLSIQAGCASDEDPAENGGSSGSGGGATGGTGGGGETGGTGGGGETGGTGGGGETGGSGGGVTGGSGGGSSSCPVGQAATVAEVADATTTGIQVDIKGAIATTEKLIVYFGKAKGSCLWGMFVKDPNADRGLMVVSYGDNAPENSSQSECPAGTDDIPEGIVPGDVLDIVGQTDAYAPSTCTTGAAKQRQLKACSATKTGSGAAPAPVVVSDLDALATGAAQYQGLLVKIENVTAENFDGGAVGPYGIIELDGTELQVNDKFYYTESGAPQFDPSQQFGHIIGISHLDYCDWVLQPRDKCADFNPASKDCI